MTDLEKLENLAKVASAPGNYNCNPYMHGMANGLILAVACIKNELPNYLDAPKHWLDSMGEPNAPPETISSATTRIHEERC